MADEFTKLESLLEQVKAYANTRIARMKLSLAEKISATLAFLIAALLATLVLAFFLVFAGVAAALALGAWLGYPWLGFLLMAIVYLLLAGLIWFGRRRLILLPLMNALVQQLFDETEEEEKTDEKD